MDIELMVERNAIEELAKKVLGHHTFPPFLFVEDKYNRLVLGMSENNHPIGMAYGVIEHGADTLFLHFIYIKKEYRTCKNVKALLNSIFIEAINTKNVRGAVWKFISDDNNIEINSRIQLLTKIPYCSVRDIHSSKQFRVNTKNFSHLQQFKIFNPKLWMEKGYYVLRLSECNVELVDKMHNKGNSPFDKRNKNNLHIDEYNSFVFARDNMQEPMGWIVCSLICKNEITIRHFFMYETERAKIIAHSFAAYVLSTIALSFDYLWFDVTKGNRQMEMIVNNYFAPIIDKKSINYSLNIDFVQVC